MNTQTEPEAICCPEFDPTPWDDKTFEWQDKKFIREKVFTFFYMPVNFGKAMKKLDERVTRAGAKMPDYLCLSEHTSKWNMDLYLAVDKEIPGTENATLSGKFFSKVYEGNFKDTGKWNADFDKTVKAKGFKPAKRFMWYTTCPKCARKYGKNYVAILSQVD